MNDDKTPILKFGANTPIPRQIVTKITEIELIANNRISHSATVQILTKA